MAELGTKIRLQPSLLDRLTDETSDAGAAPLRAFGIDQARLRELLQRDLTWLLNTTHLAASEDLSAFPEVRRSVLNYGVPDLAGRTLSSVKPKELERELKEVILSFEPRLTRRSLRVQVVAGHTRSGHNGLVFLIDAELWSDPLPIEVQLQTEIDLENGTVRVEELSGRERS